MWWPVAAAGLLCLCACIALAILLPTPGRHRTARPLAHVDRLTRLPAYARIVRRQFWSMLVLVALLICMFVASLVAGSRALTAASRADQPEDIMLCVGAPVTDPATAGLLNYFARHTANFDGQRIGLTSSSLRVVPLTRDYRYASASFLRYSRLAALSRQEPLPGPQATELPTRIAEFDRPLDYVDYARSVEDVLALCMAGFPPDDGSPRRRSLIYLGDTTIRTPDEQRPSLFTAQQVRRMAAEGGVQVNVLARSATGPGDLTSLAADTGGTFDTYDPAGGAADLAGDTNPELTASLDSIRAHQPAAVVAEGAMRPLADYPNVALIAGLTVAVLLCVSLAVVQP